MCHSKKSPPSASKWGGRGLIRSKMFVRCYAERWPWEHASCIVALWWPSLGRRRRQIWPLQWCLSKRKTLHLRMITRPSDRGRENKQAIYLPVALCADNDHIPIWWPGRNNSGPLVANCAVFILLEFVQKVRDCPLLRWQRKRGFPPPLMCDWYLVKGTAAAGAECVSRLHDYTTIATTKMLLLMNAFHDALAQKTKWTIRQCSPLCMWWWFVALFIPSE